MGNVVISPNIKKKRVQIDADGNEVRPFSREIVAPAEKEYVPAAEDIKKAMGKKDEEVINSTTNPLADMIKAQVQKAVQESIKGIDIGKMVEEAVKDAFK